MKQTSFPMKPDGRVTLRCGSDLSVEGIEASTMVVIVENGEGLRMKEDSEVFSLAADSDCRVILPFGVTVTIEKVGGDASIKNLSHRLVIGKVGGDLHLQQVEGASIETVSGDCILMEAVGSVEINRVGGDLMADLTGSLISSAVGGDAKVAAGSGPLRINAGGDANLKFKENSLPESRVNAGGDLTLQVTKEASGILDLSAGGEIAVHATGQDFEEESSHASIPLGDGGATLTLSAGGDILVTDQEEKDWEFDEDLDAMDDHWDDFGIEIEQKIREGLKSVSESVRQATLHAAHAGQMAEEKMNQAMRHLEERGISAGRKRKVVGFTFGDSNFNTRVKPAGASDEERMIVLRMLQEKKISVEEAEKLLNALDH